MRENAAMKARRLLAEGRLTVLHVGQGEIRASCKGDSGAVHRIAYAEGRWLCSCPALGFCSHAQAVALVTVPCPVGLTLRAKR